MRVSLTIIFLMFLSVSVLADKKESSWFSSFIADDETIETIKNETYTEECGECHFDYQPGLLPKRSWVLMMKDSSLEDHFGEFLEYEPDVKKVLVDHLNEYSAEKSQSEIAHKILKSIKKDEAPLEISKTRYMIRKHDEIPEKMITGNKDVGTLGNCNACHTEAEKGDYDEDKVEIPNYPNYEED